MVRIFGPIVGLGFVAALLLSLGSGVISTFNDPPAATAEQLFHKESRELALASNGLAGTFDNRQLQRGFQVYSEVCSACHSLKYVAFRDLRQLGYTENEVKKIAADWKTPVPSINPETGEPATRKATPADHFPSPFANETAARAANNNALPPDLTLMTKAREGGPAYVYSLVTGYQAQPAALLKQFPDARTPTGLYYNPYFANLNIAMPPPLVSDGQVSYADGTKSTTHQMASDVAAFLVWTAEPNLARRHAIGYPVILYLLVATVLGFMAYKNIWAGVKGKPPEPAPAPMPEPVAAAPKRRSRKKTS